MDSHQQEQVAFIEIFGDKRQRSLGTEGKAGLNIAGANKVQRLFDILCRLEVKGQPIRSRFDKPFHIVERVIDHDMHIEKHLGRAVDGRHSLRADCQIGHKVAIHDIDVQEIGAIDSSMRLASSARWPKSPARMEGATLTDFLSMLPFLYAKGLLIPNLPLKSQASFP